jgi:hypothetical protein
MNQFTGGGIMCQTEPLDQISDERLYEIRHIIPVTDTTVTPLDIMCSERFPGPIKVSLSGRDIICVCITNWSDHEEKELTLNMSDLSLDIDSKYAVSGFYSGQFFTDICTDDVVSLGKLSPHASEVIKIEKIADKPIIVSSDNHYSMGGECNVFEIINDELVIEVGNYLPIDINYKILLPDGYSYNGIRLVNICISKESPDIESLSFKLKLQKC